MTCTSPNCNKKSLFSQATNIATGITNIVSKIPAIETIALERLAICNICPMAKVMVKMGDNVVKRCGVCKCLIDLKVRVKDEVCPQNKW